MTFKELSLIEPLLKALSAEGYSSPTPIQQKAIPIVLEGRDLLGCAQTGTGKTAAFALPLLQLLCTHKPQAGKRPIRALIVTPTRELAIQIAESFAAYGKHTDLTCRVIFGGVSQHSQEMALQRGADILVATPGRLLDLMSQKIVSLQHLNHFVLDEADRMLDMGFINDVRKIVAKLPLKRQTLFFSATMPLEIQRLANTILENPVKVEVEPKQKTAALVKQAIYFVEKSKKALLLKHVLKDDSITSAIVFTRTKHGANRVCRDLVGNGIMAAAIHGNKSQNARQNALNDFKKGTLRVLVATDIASRGIDVDDLSHVINYELPNLPETYVHRIGRTGRAGANGIALSFCDHEEKEYLRDIHRLTAQTIPAVDHPYPMSEVSVQHLKGDNHGQRKKPAQRR